MDPTDDRIWSGLAIGALFDARLELAALELRQKEIELTGAKAEIRRLRHQLKAASQAGLVLWNGLSDEAEAAWDASTTNSTQDPPRDGPGLSDEAEAGEDPDTAPDD